MSHSRSSLVTALTLSTALLTPSAHAIEAGPVSIHGSVSVSASSSDEYNYLGETADTLDLNIVELTLNGAHRFENGLRASAQIYAVQIGDYNDLVLDFASLDYSFNERFGVRLGRNKHAFGLYGDAQDVDVIRPFALLPLDIYDKTLRPINAAIDGVSFYGNLPLGGAGSLDYQLDAGWVPPIDLEAPFFQGIASATPYRDQSISDLPVLNAWIFWNTPVEGLRLGATYLKILEGTFHGTMKTSSDLLLASSDARLIPFAFVPGNPAASIGFYDAMIAGRPTHSELDYTATYLSAEYTRGDWQFAAEAAFTDAEQTIDMPILGRSVSAPKAESYYGMVTWQATDRLQLGSYYGIAYADKNDRKGRTHIAVPDHTAWLKDFAFAASFQLTDWWLLKAEGHLLDGTKGVNGAFNRDAATWKGDWTYFVLKSTISF